MNSPTIAGRSARSAATKSETRPVCAAGHQDISDKSERTSCDDRTSYRLSVARHTSRCRRLCRDAPVAQMTVLPWLSYRPSWRRIAFLLAVCRVSVRGGTSHPSWQSRVAPRGAATCQFVSYRSLVANRTFCACLDFSTSSISTRLCRHRYCFYRFLALDLHFSCCCPLLLPATCLTYLPESLSDLVLIL